MDDRIEKRIELNAPVARVWRALTDHREFGEWFRVKLEGPFVGGRGSPRPDHPSRLRACQMGRRRAETGARTALFLHLVPSQSFDKADYYPLRTADACRIQAGNDPRPARYSCSPSPASPVSRATVA